MMVTKLRIGDANTMMAEGGIQAADKENDSPSDTSQSILDFGSALTRTAHGTVYCLTIIGQIEGHSTAGQGTKTTKYEHVLPLLAKLEESDRLQALAVELKALAIRLVSNMLGVDKLQSGEYMDMMGDVASTLTDALQMPEAKRDALLLNSIKENFAGQGFDVPDDVALKMSHQMIDELGADGEISPDELTDYLVNHADEGFDIMGDVEIPDELPEGLPDMQP